MGAWAFSGAMLSFLLYRESDIKVSDFLIGVLIIILAAIIFIILTIFTKNWLLLLMTIPFSLIGYLFIKQSKKVRSEEHTSELQSRGHLVCRLLLEKKKK